MSTIQTLLGTFLAVSVVFMFATFSPSDEDNFWMYWAVSAVLFGSGYLFAIMFGDQKNFVYDPSPENWRRKTNS